MDEKSVRVIRNLVSHSGGVAGLVMQKSTVAMQDEPCPVCGGAGWKDVGSGHDRRVTRCDCFVRTQAKHLLQSAEIPARYKDCDFSTYQTQHNNSLAIAKIQAEAWASQFPLETSGLLILGPSGVGKTHLGVATLKHLCSKGFRCLFCDYRELLKQIQNSYNSSAEITELQV